MVRKFIAFSVFALSVAPPELGHAQSSFGWVAECKRDAITDKVKCHVANYAARIFVSFGSEPSPRGICILGHDFPGRTGVIRVDKNKPLTTSAEGCLPANPIFQQMLKGSKIITRRYEWPDDFPQDDEGSLRGLQDVLVKVKFLRSHTP